MTPNDIEVLLHYYVNPKPHPRLDAPAVQGSLDLFVRKGLMTEGVRDAKLTYDLTDGGRLLVKALCAVPFPELRWCMPDEKLIP